MSSSLCLRSFLFNSFTIRLAQFLTIQSFDNLPDSDPYFQILCPSIRLGSFPSNTMTISLNLLLIIKSCDQLSDSGPYYPIL